MATIFDKLLDAINGGNVSEAERLIETGIDLNSPCDQGATPLYAAILNGHHKVEISARFNVKQQAFLNFVLAHYVSEGVQELDQEKLTPLLLLKYNDSISDAVADLGRPEEIGKVFAGFQQYLYQGVA